MQAMRSTTAAAALSERSRIRCARGASRMYGNPIEVAGTTHKPSVLAVEGLGGYDCINCTRSLAHTMGLAPILEPVWQAVPYLPVASAPLSGNFDSATAGFPSIAPTPGCEGEPNGHYCAQIAPSSLHQRVRFFQTAVNDPVPTIVNPFED